MIANLRRCSLTFALMLASLFLITACSEDKPATLAAQQAAAIESGDECHLCGMLIGNFPGPKGQLYQRGQSQTKKFCSTRDLFAYLLDPEHQHSIQSVFVHDMAVTPWDHPDAETYIDARQAWYVVGSSRKGAMGPTLASFSAKDAATAFAEEYGGQLYRFEQLDLSLVSQMHF
ncbi:MAG: copper chaperone NosL [Motiliproteus sp.]|jgi:copper chaperone NosL